MEDYKTFAERLREERVKKGWNKKVLCERIPELSYTTLKWWEGGRSTPTPLVQRLVLEEIRRI